jgi:dihydrodipicolinate synthase/N-acetylneuraminate lyase
VEVADDRVPVISGVYAESFVQAAELASDVAEVASAG